LEEAVDLSVDRLLMMMMSRGLTPWSRVLREKLTGPQLYKKPPAFYGTQMFITTFTNTYHLSLS
jgi:hypothetical protein